MTKRPDFIGDQFGNVRDVRSPKPSDVFHLTTSPLTKRFKDWPLVLIAASIPGCIYVFFVYMSIKHGSHSLAALLIVIAAIPILLIVLAFLDPKRKNEIARFQSKTIVISHQGVALYDTDERVERSIKWQQIKAIKLRYLRQSQLPIAIGLYLVDGNDFEIPLHMVPEENDRFAMISSINRYSPFRVGSFLKGGK